MLRRFLLVLILMSLSFIYLCGCASQNRLGLPQDYDFRWEDLRTDSTSTRSDSIVTELRRLLTIEEARLLFDYLGKLEKPSDINKLYELQKIQSQSGGGFLGIFDELTHEKYPLTEPADLESALKCALTLATYRSHCQDIMNTQMPEFPRGFSGFTPPRAYRIEVSDRYRLSFDLSFIDAVLEFYKSGNHDFKTTHELSNHPIVKNMLAHRRQLGYLQPPLPNDSDYARFILLSAEKSPEVMIFKWLNPHNLFGFADFYRYRENYDSLVDVIREREKFFSDRVMGHISWFLMEPLRIHDTLGIGVNWGIRSWATADGYGSNIIMFKDNYEMFLQTVTHETFHRFQLHLCPLAPSLRDKPLREFDDLVYWDFDDPRDRKFYEILAHITLEGTASYVGGMYYDESRMESVREALMLLQKCHRAVYDYKDFEEADKLLNEGLVSNGPFYILGYYISKELVDNNGTSVLGGVLMRGPLQFYKTYIDQSDSPQKTAELPLDDELKATIIRLYESQLNSM